MVKIRHLGRVLLGLVTLFAFSTGAKADVTLPTIGSMYIIHSYDRSGVLTPNATNTGVVHDVFVPQSSYWTIEAAGDATDVTGGVYLKNGDGYYITSSRGLTTSADEAGTFYIYSFTGRDTETYTNTPAEGLAISITAGQASSESFSDCFDAANYSTNVGSYSNSASDGKGTTWVFEEVTSTTDTYLNYLNPDQTKVYTVKASDTSRGGLYCASGATTVITSYNNTFDATDNATQFAFIKSDAGNLYMYSIGAAGFISYNSTTDRWDITSTPQSTSLRIIPAWTEGATQSSEYPFVIQGGSSWKGMNLGSGQNTVCGYGAGRYYQSWESSWYSQQGDGGNKVAIDAVDNVTFDATDVLELINTYENITTAYNALQTKIAEAEAYTITTDGTLYTYSETTSGAMSTALTDAKAIDKDNTTAAAIAAAQTALEEAIAGLTFNVPATGKFYRIKNTATSVYLAATNANSYAGFDASASTSNIFYYDENSYLVNYSTGYRVAANGPKLYFGGVDDAVAITLKVPTNGASGCCNVCYTGSGRSERLYISGSGTDSDPYWANNLDYGDKNSTFISTNLDNFTLEEVSTIPVTIGTSGYGTLYTPVALTIPEGATVYYISSVDQTNMEAVVATLEGTIPANTAVLVTGTASSYDFPIAASSDYTVSDNYLKGQIASIDATTVTNPYTMQKINDVSGFAKFTGAELRGFKCYLENPVSTSGTLALHFGDATGINAINAATENGNATIYDLQGRRVNAATRGLYIVNGKKVLVK